ncbi:MAG: hypothetical protein QM811_23820 [Pirellulales bacterium]
MLVSAILYVTAALMALVAIACTALCLVWSVPAWRSRLAQTDDMADAHHPRAAGLSGRPARIGSVLISVGIGACTLLAWYGVYGTLTAM